MSSPGRPPRLRRSRFRTPDHSREFLIVRWIQLILLALLSGASFLLAFTSYRVVQTHFVEKYGGRAYFLPVAASALGLFLLLRLILHGRLFRKECGKEGSDEEAEP